ncbi:hypothetical protein ATKI12_2804 [Kitasatospora sp. Ki12]
MVLAASLGAAGLALLWTPFAGWWAMPGTDMTPAGHFLVGFLYLPTVAWAPLLAAVTVSYHRRHRAALPIPPADRPIRRSRSGAAPAGSRAAQNLIALEAAPVEPSRGAEGASVLVVRAR